jgi:hypothetical protein
MGESPDCMGVPCSYGGFDLVGLEDDFLWGIVLVHHEQIVGGAIG